VLLSILSLIVFIFIIIIIIKQPRIKIPRSKKSFQLDYGFAPLLGVGILLCVGILSSQLDPSVIFIGIVGTSTIRPYMIIILFFSLAYVCISIDLTGFFEYLALTAAKKSGSSGKKLFFYFFLLSSVLTIFTSNDIVILTLTPIIVYFCKYTKTNPVPYLIGQFFAANIWSNMLYIGNPTNIIVAQANRLTFAGYTEVMFFPTIAAGLLCYALLLLVFRKDIPITVTPPDIDPVSALKDPAGAKFSLVMLGTCLAFLSIAPIFDLDMGLICLIFAFIMMGKDIVYEYKVHKRGIEGTHQHSIIVAGKRMPWKIMPFIFGMFIMVEILGETQWISLLAAGFVSLETNIGPFSSVFFMSYVSSLACNIMNNQPMTILFTRMLQDPAFQAVGPAIQVNMYALISGSNFGANFTLIGALAGIMWSSITAGKGIQIKYKQFAKYGFIIMPWIVAIASVVLVLEFTMGLV
jgi:arsenical pump membrane protein